MEFTVSELRQLSISSPKTCEGPNPRSAFWNGTFGPDNWCDASLDIIKRYIEKAVEVYQSIPLSERGETRILLRIEYEDRTVVCDALALLRINNSVEIAVFQEPNLMWHVFIHTSDKHYYLCWYNTHPSVIQFAAYKRLNINWNDIEEHYIDLSEYCKLLNTLRYPWGIIEPILKTGGYKVTMPKE